MRVHFCLFARRCKALGEGGPRRVYIFTKRWHYAIGAKSQVWTKKEGWTGRYSWVTRFPVVDFSQTVGDRKEGAAWTR